MNKLSIMDSTGDSTIEFEAGTAHEAEAKALFERLISGGARAFEVGGSNRPVSNFADVQGEVLIVPVIVGG